MPLLGFLLKHGGGLGLPAIRWWWLIRLIRWWWWLIRPGRERPTPRSRPGRERPTPRPGLAVPDPNGLEVTRADLGLDERDPRHGLGSPSPIPAGLEIVPFENQIAAALGASLGHHRRVPISAWGGCWVCAVEIGLGWWVCIGFVDSVGLGLCGGGLGLCRGLGWLNRWLEVDFVYWVCCGWVFGGGGSSVVGLAGVGLGLRDRDQHLRFGAAFNVSFGVLEVHCTGALTALFTWHFAAFRHISTDTRRRLLINDNAGVRINSSIKASIVEAGGYENVTYNQRDVRNFLEKERRLKCKEGDGQALHDYFVRMQAKNSNFYHALDLDDELRVRNVFWVDARSRAAYESFNDVITFDTTYLTNKYDMPFAPFIGINHHGNGCKVCVTLLQKPLSRTNVQAMRRAIEIVFPETVHRWCIWHITMKLPVKLAGLEAYQDIKHYLLKAVHDSMTVEEFEEKWNHTITLHHLEENEWLAKLYEERERWVPAFLNSNFFAGMSSTQRSESMNAFFDGYLHSSTTLKVFVEQFENAMRNKVEKEILSDFECFKGKLECSSSSPMEKQFQEAYTHEIFKRIEDEACSGKLFEVRFSSSECLVGLCGERISKENTLTSPLVQMMYNITLSLERYEKLHRLAVGVLEIGADPRLRERIVLELLLDVVRTEVVRSPMVVKRKGRPRMKRLKSSMEEAVSKPKKKRNTAAARNLAHSTSTTGVGGSAYGDGSTSNMEYPVSMPHSNDGVIHLTNPMPSQSFVSESMSQTQAHGNEDQALNLT
uniref:Protein FAR1-RELATED SEQUENCE n=1 Tax=Fagus sylvatica TaxID=28930 RepID=A0A2N9IE97_FAGSY